MTRFRQLLAICALTALLPLSGCLFRSHKVEQHLVTTNLKTATRDELVAAIDQQAAQIRTLNATVDIATDVGGEKKGKVTEYSEIRGYILMRQPNDIRMIGLFPLVRNTAFDMVSNGDTFRVSIPTSNKFYVGHNGIIRPSKQPLENLRPQHIMDALLLHPIDPQNEIVVLEQGVEKITDPKTRKQLEEPDYILIVLRRDGSNDWFLARKVIVSREDLRVHRQIVYDKLGNIATDARYSDFKPYDGAEFPSAIQINRPQEEYSITLGMVKLTLNQPLKPEQFALNQPAGSQLIDLDLPQQARNGATASPSNSGSSPPPPPDPQH